MERRRKNPLTKLAGSVLENWIVAALLSGQTIASAGFALFAKEAWQVSPLASVAMGLGLVVVSASLVMLWLGKDEWVAERKRTQSAEHTLEILCELRDRAKLLIDNPPKPEHQDIAHQKWVSAMEATLETADFWSRPPGLPRDIAVLIHNPKRRPLPARGDGPPPDLLDRQLYELFLVYYGLGEAVAAYSIRERVTL